MRVVDGNWGTWDNWSICSKTCGIGTHRRIRECNNPSPKYGGRFCNLKAQFLHDPSDLSPHQSDISFCKMYESVYRSCIRRQCPSKHLFIRKYLPH